MENNGIMQLVCDSPYVDVLWRGDKEELAELFKWVMNSKEVRYTGRRRALWFFILVFYPGFTS